MNCERCHKESEGYQLHDYCEVCSKNLCGECMENGRCKGGHKHKPANHGGEDDNAEKDAR